MVRIFQYKRAIDLFGEFIEADRDGGHEFPKESYYLYEWLGEDAGRCESLDFLVNGEFPQGTDEDEYRDFFRDEWKKIAEECRCPEHYLREGY